MSGQETPHWLVVGGCAGRNRVVGVMRKHTPRPSASKTRNVLTENADDWLSGEHQYAPC